MASDRVAAAVAELYGADPDAFTERRKALVAAAREAGDKRAAAAVGALRKPTRAAWLVNRLARADPDAPARLAAMAAELRAAEQAKDGSRLRELSAARGSLIDALTAQALAADGSGAPDPSPSLRAEVTATLTAALADPETAAGFAAGTLTKAAQWSGFGYADFGPADDSAPDDRSAPSHPAAAPRPIRLPKQAGRLKRDRADAGSSADARTGRGSAQATAQRAAQEQRRVAGEAEKQRLAAEAEAERLAREAAERAARAREKFDDAERTLAQASAAAAEAAAVEDRLEAEVRDLEGRVTQTREDLAAARRRARHAEAAERRARQNLDRLPRDEARPR